MKIDEDERIFEFSDGLWIPMDFLLPNVDSAKSEWERLYKKLWFTHDMFKECIKSIEKLYNVDMFDIIHESGLWALEKDQDALDFFCGMHQMIRRNIIS